MRTLTCISAHSLPFLSYTHFPKVRHLECEYCAPFPSCTPSTSFHLSPFLFSPPGLLLICSLSALPSLLQFVFFGPLWKWKRSTCHLVQLLCSLFSFLCSFLTFSFSLTVPPAFIYRNSSLSQPNYVLKSPLS